jgi:tetratricopeptide (TPR) repeat protein
MPLPVRGATVPTRNTFARSIAYQIAWLPILIYAAFCPTLAAQSVPPTAENFRLEARAAAAKADWAEAAADYQKAADLAPHDPSLRVELAAALANAGQHVQAIAACQQALQISPHHLPAELALAQSYRAVHNYDETRRVLERAHTGHPKSAAPLVALGDLELELQTYNAAIAHLRPAVTLNPTDTHARNLLVAAYKAKGDNENALAQLSKVLARDPQNALAYFQRAQIYSAQNDDVRALPDAEKAVELQPKNLSARLVLAKILLQTPDKLPAEKVASRCSRAAANLQPLVEAKPNDSETLFILSRAYRCAGRADEAEKTLAAFEAASQNDRSTKQDQLQAKHLVDEAESQAMKNDFPGALDSLHQAIEKDPTFSPAYSLLAKINFSSGNLEQASEAISRALALAPYVPDFLFVQGKIFEREGKLDDALASFERASLVNPKESDLYYEMGVIYQQRNDRPRALAAYKKAAELSPDGADYRRAVAALSAATPAR